MAEEITCLYKKPEQKAKIYACLWNMMNKEDVVKFKENEKLFTTYWATKQSKFVEYYNNE